MDSKSTKARRLPRGPVPSRTPQWDADQMITALFELCTDAQRTKMCAVHLSMYCACPPTTRQPCKKCLRCQAAMQLAVLKDYMDARDRKEAAVKANKNQAEEDAALDVEMYEKRLRALMKGK